MVQGLFLAALMFLAYTQLIKGKSLLGCKDRCGNVPVEYPFGISPGCFYAGDRSFKLTCNETNKSMFGGIEVINISHNGELRVLSTRSYVCYNQLGNRTDGKYYTSTLANLTFSHKNRFIAVGCDTYAFLNTDGVGNYSTGCMSICDELINVKREDEEMKKEMEEIKRGMEEMKKKRGMKNYGSVERVVDGSLTSRLGLHSQTTRLVDSASW